MKSKFYSLSKEIIYQVIADLSLSAKEKLRKIDSLYPFGLREGHPYKMWLKARREAVSDLRCIYGEVE